MAKKCKKHVKRTICSKTAPVQFTREWLEQKHSEFKSAIAKEKEGWFRPSVGEFKTNKRR